MNLIGVPEWAQDNFVVPLDYRSIMGTRKIQLTDSFAAHTSHGTVLVPKGYVSDGASVPQVFWSVFPPYGKYLEAAVIHDYIYTDLCHVFTKQQADEIFKELCLALRVSSVKASIMYQCVRMGGRGAW